MTNYEHGFMAKCASMGLDYGTAAGLYKMAVNTSWAVGNDDYVIGQIMRRYYPNWDRMTPEQRRAAWAQVPKDEQKNLMDAYRKDVKEFNAGGTANEKKVDLMNRNATWQSGLSDPRLGGGKPQFSWGDGDKEMMVSMPGRYTPVMHRTNDDAWSQGWKQYQDTGVFGPGMFDAGHGDQQWRMGVGTAKQYLAGQNRRKQDEVMDMRRFGMNARPGQTARATQQYNPTTFIPASTAKSLMAGAVNGDVQNLDTLRSGGFNPDRAFDAAPENDAGPQMARIGSDNVVGPVKPKRTDIQGGVAKINDVTGAV